MCSLYKMIIVDDEAGIKDSLCGLFEWEKLGYEITGSFEEYDGALDHVRRHATDVLLTDIRLGNRLGINLVREAREIRPGITAVLISAYSEFEYAREAISLNVFEYLLKPISYADIESCFKRLYHRLSGQADPIRASAEEIREPSNAYYIGVAKAYIEKHLSENLSLDCVAEQLSISPAYLSRYFRQHTGIKFIDYLSRVRIEKAKELLADPSVKLSGICHRVGYHSKSQFYSVFTHYTGHTPADYRNHILGESYSPLIADR